MFSHKTGAILRLRPIQLFLRRAILLLIHLFQTFWKNIVLPRGFTKHEGDHWQRQLAGCASRLRAFCVRVRVFLHRRGQRRGQTQGSPVHAGMRWSLQVRHAQGFRRPHPHCQRTRGFRFRFVPNASAVQTHAAAAHARGGVQRVLMDARYVHRAHPKGARPHVWAVSQPPNRAPSQRAMASSQPAKQ